MRLIFFFRADPAVDVAASIIDIFGGGAGAGRWGVFCDLGANGLRSGEAVCGVRLAFVLASERTETFFTSPSILELGFDFLNVGGGSFS